jgi:hypothetical protein
MMADFDDRARAEPDPGEAIAPVDDHTDNPVGLDKVSCWVGAAG